MIPCITCGAPCYPSGRCADPTHEGGPSQPGYPSTLNRRDKALTVPSDLPALGRADLYALALALLQHPEGEAAVRAALLEHTKAARKGQGR